MQKLLVYILTNVKLEYRVLSMVINAFHVIVVDVDKLAYEMCSIIADIKDPLEPVEIPIEVRSNQDVEVYYSLFLNELTHYTQINRRLFDNVMLFYTMTIITTLYVLNFIFMSYFRLPN